MKLNVYRFLPPSVAEKYDLDLPDYKGVEQIVEVAVKNQASEKI